MPSLTSFKRSARGFVNNDSDTRATRDEDQSRRGGSGTPTAESSKPRDNRSSPSRRAFFRGLIVTSKAKLGSRRSSGTTDTTACQVVEKEDTGTVSPISVEKKKNRA